MIIAVALLAFLAGAAVGGLAVLRHSARLVALLPQPERIAFARKVSQLARR